MKHLERALDGQNQFWKYPVNVIAGFLASNIIGAIPLLGVIAYKTYKSGGAVAPNAKNLADLSGFGISPNLGLFLMMIPFLFALGTTILLLKPLHKRTFTEVVNGTKQIRWRRYFVSFGIWVAISAIYLVFDSFISPANYILQFDLASFIPLIILAVVFIPIQTAYEELLFRGYLAQGVAAWTKNRLLAILIPAVLFGLMHSFNPEVEEYGFAISMAQYIFFGLLFGLITILDDGIEIAAGAHAANNIFLCLFITSESSVLQTSAVFKQTNVDPVKETIALMVLGVLLVFLLSRVYKWNWTLIGRKVETPTLEVTNEQEGPIPLS